MGLTLLTLNGQRHASLMTIKKITKITVQTKIPVLNASGDAAWERPRLET